MSHAIARHPIDVCEQRGEERVVLGNSGVVRVLKAGLGVEDIKEGDLAIFFGNSKNDSDPHGYMVYAHGYDAPGSVGLLAKQTKVNRANLHPIPAFTKYSLRHWAAFSLRYVTAWSNWKLAYGCYRLQMSEDDMPVPFVWGWGGGTTLAELDLARRHRCRATQISGHGEHINIIERTGIQAVDRRQFPSLIVDEENYARSKQYRESYRSSEDAFTQAVMERTGGAGISIFIDYIGTPVFRATLRALARQAVVSTAGWRGGMGIHYNRAVACIKRHTLVHTHYARQSELREATQYAEETGWMPPLDDRVYGWEEIPRLAEDFMNNRISSYFPIYQVNA